jgi:hypothetical protein
MATKSTKGSQSSKKAALSDDQLEGVVGGNGRRSHVSKKLKSHSAKLTKAKKRHWTRPKAHLHASVDAFWATRFDLNASTWHFDLAPGSAIMTNKSPQSKETSPTDKKAALADAQLDAVVGGSGEKKVRIEIDPTKVETPRVKKPWAAQQWEALPPVHFVFDAIAEMVFQRFGTWVKRLFGREPSETGTAETWIGASILAAILVLAFAVLPWDSINLR